MTLLEQLKKNSTIKESSSLDDSRFFNDKEMVSTPVPAMNIALSGRLDGGFTSGLTTFAGVSKHFKTGFVLLLAKAYMDKHKDCVLMFYDSEFGTPKNYFKSFNIDTSRVLHIPILNVEQLKFDIIKQLNTIKREDKVIFVIDSVGNLASKKEIEDAENEKSVADMSRAKQLKSLFRMVTPHLTIKDIPMLIVNHTYKEIGLYPKDIVSGGTGSYYSSDNIFIIGRQQEKVGTEIEGYNFIVNVEKSRYVKEKSKIPISVNFENGISKWSGLIDIAMDIGAVVKPSNGWYSRVDMETGEVEDKKYRMKDTDNKEFWNPIITNEIFKESIRKRYQIGYGDIMKKDVEIDTLGINKPPNGGVSFDPDEDKHIEHFRD